MRTIAAQDSTAVAFRISLHRNLSSVLAIHMELHFLCRVAGMPVNDRRELRQRLVALAGAQSGYFSAAQALAAGYSYQAQKQNADRGNWVKVGRGLFRLPGWPAGRHEDLVRLSLWSRGRAVVSHESALSVHELGDVNPARTHLTVPKGFRQHPPAGVVLHQGVLPEGDVRDQEGFRVTTPLRSLLDTAAGDLDLDLLAGAIEDALEQGVLDRPGQQVQVEVGPKAALRIERALHRGES